MRCQDRAGQRVAVDFTGDVAGIELFDLVGEDAAFVTDVAACEGAAARQDGVELIVGNMTR